MPFFQKCRTTSDNHPQSAGWSRLWYTPFRQHQIFNSHSLQSESSVFDSNGRWNTLSTRTHYRMTPITIGLTKNMTVSFQLALTTKWIPSWIFWQNAADSFTLRSMQVKSNLPYTHNTRRCHFNSHSLRSVSYSTKYIGRNISLSTRTHYGVYPPGKKRL